MKKTGHRIVINLIKNNAGSTLITVIVAIAFVTILTSIILGSSVVNIRMKAIDNSARDEFYYAERTINDVFTGIGQELAKIAGDEYEKAFEKVGTIEGTEDYNMAETAEKEFRKNFLEKAHDKIDSLDRDALQDFVQPGSGGTVESIGAKEYQKQNGVPCTLSEAYRVVFRDVKVSAQSPSLGTRIAVSTDIVINVPTVDFLGSNADVSDYGLIANEGLYIEGDSEITGNVYAGVHESANSMDDTFEEDTDKNARGEKSGGIYKGVYGGINIRDGKATFDGNYIISKGDINLSGNNPQIKVNSHTGGADANLANMWFTTIRTITNKPGGLGATITNDPVAEPTIDLNANVFALNDMTLNADNSSVVIRGNYYGYNDGGSGITTLGEIANRYDSKNSAIIVNGSKAYINMEQINNFVLMGRAYIDFTSDDDISAEGTLTQVVPTAEGVALKTNQQLYLMPTDFLDGPNPEEGGTGVFNISIPETDLQKWFGYDFLDKSSPTSSIHKSYKVKLSGGSDVYYDYLVFDERQNDVSNKYDNKWKPDYNVGSLGTETEDVKYIVNKKPDGTFRIDKYTRSDDDLGTGGSISSKTMFFLKVMAARNAYEYMYTIDPDASGRSPTEYIRYKEEEAADKPLQPSAYRLYDRIKLSMDYDYFDLSKCVVGDMSNLANAHYYAKNAVVNYDRIAGDIQSNVMNNTEGMLRYAGYTQNLYRRYVWLCTKLDGKETVLLDSDPGDPGSAEWKVTYDSVDDAAPICHYIKLNNVGSMTITDSISAASGEGLKPGAYGVCIAQTGDLNLNSVPAAALTTGAFKGVAIVEGNITVPEGMDVDGLLMATGTITLKGNNHIHYDKGLIQSRIEKEMNIVKNKSKDTTDIYGGKRGYMNHYIISYLSKDAGGTPQLIYDVEAGSKIRRDRIEADYNDFMHYENWQKSE